MEASADTAQKARDGLMAAMDQVDALNKLNQLRTLYNQRRYSQARTLLAEWEAAAPAGWKPPSRRSATLWVPWNGSFTTRWRPTAS